MSLAVDRLSEVRPLLHRSGGFTVGLVDSDADTWNYGASWPTHKTVLLPLLNASVDCFAYGLKPGTPPHAAIAERAQRDKGRHRIRTDGDCVSGREVFWNTNCGGRGSVVFYVPTEMFRPEAVFPHCFGAWVMSNFVTGHTPSAVRSARERASAESVVALLLSRNNGIEWLDIFVHPSRAESMFVAAEQLVQARP